MNHIISHKIAGRAVLANLFLALSGGKWSNDQSIAWLHATRDRIGRTLLVTEWSNGVLPPTGTMYRRVPPTQAYTQKTYQGML